jgi:hypothetical protein
MDYLFILLYSSFLERKRELILNALITLPVFFCSVILITFISVARVRPRTSKGITDLLFPQTSMDLTSIVPQRRQCQPKLAQLFSRLRSRSLTELTRQITPPTKNGHAPPPIKSRMSCQSYYRKGKKNNGPPLTCKCLTCHEKFST